MATTNAKENIVVKDLNGNYLLYQVPAGTANQATENDWSNLNPVFIQRLTQQQYNQYFITNKNTITIDRSQNAGGSTAVSEPLAFVVMATTLVAFSLSKKLKSFFA